MRTELEARVFDIYSGTWSTTDSKQSRPAPCIACRSAADGACLSAPVSIHRVGPLFSTDAHRLMFVGKAARENPEPIPFIDATRYSAQLFFKKTDWHFWSYTRAVCEQVFGSAERGWDSIAMSNLVKCATSDIDTTPPDRARRCVGELRMIWREIELLRPRKVIFYTAANNTYDALIRDWGGLPVTTVIADHRRPCGAKKTAWWHGRVSLPGAEWPVDFLRTSHPERKKKAPFVRMVSEWITKGRST